MDSLPVTKHALKDYRPISLIGSLYKILVKVMANRLWMVLPEIISNIQGGFVDGRQILDGVLISHECIDSRNRQCRPGLVCKLDIEKACGLERNDVNGFIVVSSAHFSILVNGSSKG